MYLNTEHCGVYFMFSLIEVSLAMAGLLPPDSLYILCGIRGCGSVFKIIIYILLDLNCHHPHFEIDYIVPTFHVLRHELKL